MLRKRRTKGNVIKLGLVNILHLKPFIFYVLFLEIDGSNVL